MRSPQQKMNYIIQQLNKSKKSGGGICFGR